MRRAVLLVAWLVWLLASYAAGGWAALAGVLFLSVMATSIFLGLTLGRRLHRRIRMKQSHDAKMIKTLRRGKQPGTLVVDYPPGEERPYMIAHYGGRLVAEGVAEADIRLLLKG